MYYIYAHVAEIAEMCHTCEEINNISIIFYNIPVLIKNAFE